MATSLLCRPAAYLLSLLLCGSAMAAAPEAAELLAADHWSQRVVQRLEELGLLKEHLPAQNQLTRAQVHAALQEAAQRAGIVAAEFAPLASAFLGQFEDEFREHRSQNAAFVAIRGLSASAGPALVDVRSSPVTPELVAPRHVSFPEEATMGFLSARASATVTRHLAVSVEPLLASSGPELQSWEAVAGWGGFELSAGKTPISYGLRGGRGAIMSGAQSMERLELRTSAPFRLPGFLRYLGAWAIDVFATRVHETRHPGNPYLWGMSVRLRPHPRLTIGAQRGVMYGGGIDPRARGWNVWKMLIASQNQQENNLGSADFLLRLPTEKLVPLTLYGEWAADDLGAQFKAPGIMAGLRTPALPGLPNVAVGGEFAFFGVLCCRTHTWYEHGNHVGGWVLDGAPLGHPMGGDGREYRVYGEASLFESRLDMTLQAVLRDRFATNLFAPYRPGHSFGLSSSVRWRLAPRGQLGVSWEQEWGRDWRSGALVGQVSAFF